MMTGRCWQHLLLLCFAAVVEIILVGNPSEAAEEPAPLIKNLTDKRLQVIPLNENHSSVTTLVSEWNLITLNEMDRQALASYPTLVELYLDGNLVTTVPAKYFSAVPLLRVLSLANNNINSLDPEAFSGLDVLKELDLSHNKLTNLPTQLITGLKHLQMLHLQDNPWNCSCHLLSTIGKMRAANITIECSQIICTYPEVQAGRNLLETTDLCSTSPPLMIPTDPQNPTLVSPQQSQGLSVILKTTLSSSQNHSSGPDQTPVLGNTWKFTACVAALALTTSLLITSAVKGPSWYKRFHNYRHQRLHHDDGLDGDDIVSTVFSEERGYQTQLTFSFEEQHGHIEDEKEDNYFEDPYIKRED